MFARRLIWLLTTCACASSTPESENPKAQPDTPASQPSQPAEPAEPAEAPDPAEAPGQVLVAADATAQELFDAIRWFTNERKLPEACWIHVPDEVPVGIPFTFGVEGKTFEGKLTCNSLTATNWMVGRKPFVNVTMANPALKTHVVFSKYGPVGTTYDKPPANAMTGTGGKAAELETVALKTYDDSVTLIIMRPSAAASGAAP